ncbi:MAG: hypothetical protein R2882_10410 [Gemmatimonadales bacterium]
MCRADGSREWRIAVDTVWTDRIRPDPAEVALVGRYRPRVEAIAGRIIATLGDFVDQRPGSFPSATWMIADAQRNAVQADVGLMGPTTAASGGRSGRPATRTSSNSSRSATWCSRWRVTGTQLTDVLEHASWTASRTTMWLRLSGTTRRAAGHRIREIRKNDGG